jgi:small subunit ribosomal protein S1
MTPPTNETPNPTPSAPVVENTTTPQSTENPPVVEQPPKKTFDPRSERPKKPFKDRMPRQGGKPPTMTVQELPSGPSLKDLDKDIEAELAAAMEGFTSSEMMAEAEKPNLGGESETPGRLRGKIVGIHAQDVFVDVPNRRSQGVLPLLQFDTPPKIGDVVEFSIEGFDHENGLLKLTKSGAAAVSVDWSTVAKGVVVEARVMKTNKGGLEVEVNGIRGFMPFREIDIYRVENAETMVNQKLTCQVIEVQPSERNLVVSRRVLIEKEREREREKFWSELEEGQIRTGIVRSIKPFGVFVDMGGADGMIPISELSWARVDKPEDLVQLGQKVEVKVSKINFTERKISLSLKQLSSSPWETISERFPIGTTISGRVTRIMEFGAFVEIEPGIEGLIHISELATHRVRRVRDVVQDNQIVQSQILNIDKENRRIGLSLRSIAVANQKAENDAAMAELAAREEAEENAPKEAPKKRNYDLKGGL